MNVRETIHFVEAEDNPVSNQRTKRCNVLEEGLSVQAQKLVEELRDWGSERRHHQLVSICERHNLSHLCNQALQATRQRLSQEGKHGVLERPGAYYQRVLISLLEGHQVFVPSVGEDDAEEVRRLARLSLGLEPR